MPVRKWRLFGGKNLREAEAGDEAAACVRGGGCNKPGREPIVGIVGGGSWKAGNLREVEAGDEEAAVVGAGGAVATHRVEAAVEHHRATARHSLPARAAPRPLSETAERVDSDGGGH